MKDIVYMLLVFTYSLIAFLKCAQHEAKVEKHEVKSKTTLLECPPCETGKTAEEIKGVSEIELKYQPGVSILGHIAHKYEPVNFNHKAHQNYAQNCAECHHRQTEVDRTPPCRQCHTIAFKYPDRPGLKAAYHQQCLKCHQEKGAPTACSDCHKETTEAKKVEIPPQTAVLYHLSQQFEPSFFNHKAHEKVTEKCSTCHHMETDIEKTAPCRECHNTINSREGDKKPGLKDAYHKQCKNCHGENSKKPLGCTGCHAVKEQAPKTQEGEKAETVSAGTVSPITMEIPSDKETLRLKWKSATMPPVKFAHLKHNKKYGISCTECHHMGGDNLTCSGCHKGTKGSAGEPTYKNAMHSNCIGCHKKGKGPKDCMSCHK